MFNSIANMFRPTQQVVAAPPPPPMAQQNPGAAAVVPPSGTSNPTPAEPPNPLDDFAKMFQNDPNIKPPVDPTTAPILQSDPAKIQDAANKIDFLSRVPQDLLQKVQAGNDPAALAQLINSVAQQTLAMATNITSATAEQAARRATSNVMDALPSRVTAIQLQQMQPENPILAHPAAMPVLDMARNQLRVSNPNMPAAEINRRAEQYVMAIAQAATAPAKQDPQTVDPSEDWSKFG